MNATLNRPSEKTEKDHPILGTLGRTIALLAGAFLIVLGLGLGVTMVMLPAGAVLGIVGVLLVLWAWASPGLKD